MEGDEQAPKVEGDEQAPKVEGDEQAPKVEGDEQAPKAPLDLDAIAATLKASDKVVDPHGKLDAIIELAAKGKGGAIGELKAIERWVGEGKTVELIPETSTRSPDFRVDGKLTEVKTSERTPSDKAFGESEAASTFIRDRIKDVNHQIKKSEFVGEKGEAVIQLEDGATRVMTDDGPVDLPLDVIEGGVLSQFRPDRSTHLDTVSVYKDGELSGQWQRMDDGSIERSHP